MPPWLRLPVAAELSVATSIFAHLRSVHEHPHDTRRHIAQFTFSGLPAVDGYTDRRAADTDRSSSQLRNQTRRIAATQLSGANRTAGQAWLRGNDRTPAQLEPHRRP